MNEPWFNPNYWAWLPGTLLGCIGGAWGALAGTLAPRGKGRNLVLGGALLLLVFCGGLLAAGLIAVISGQPYGVWYGLGLPGLLGVLVIPPNLYLVRKRYGEAEQRRMQAEDL